MIPRCGFVHENCKQISSVDSTYVNTIAFDHRRGKNLSVRRDKNDCATPVYMVNHIRLLLLSVTVLILKSNPIKAAMKYSKGSAWINTRNHRALVHVPCQATISTPLFASSYPKKSPLKLPSSKIPITMITDSRELRFIESCIDARCFYSTSSTHAALRQRSRDTTSSPKQVIGESSKNENLIDLMSTNSTSSINCRVAVLSSVASAKTKSTIQALEELIATTCSRTVEERDERIPTRFRPILSASYKGSSYSQDIEANSVASSESIHSGLFGTRTTSSTVWQNPAVLQTATATTMSTKTSVRTFSTSDEPPRLPHKHPRHDDERPKRVGYGSSISLTDEERELFQLLRRVRKETHLSTTLRVAGGWVRDKLLATPEFQAYHKVYSIGKESLTQPSKSNSRLTSKFHKPAPSMGRQGTKILTAPRSVNGEHDCQPVDIDIALDDMLGREFADSLNEYLAMKGEETVSVGMVLKNPEKSKHLETATMKVNSFWIDFVNLRAEEYTQDSRIPDLMRIGTAKEDAFRRDLTINALFYNINTGEIEDWTGRGFDDLRKGIVATPLPPLTTLLDDPLRALRSIRFAARLRFTMDNELVNAAQNERVANALSLKVSRERVGGELDLMLRSPDPVGAIRLLINLKLIDCVFPFANYLRDSVNDVGPTRGNPIAAAAFDRGLDLLSTANDHLTDCQWSPPVWCSKISCDHDSHGQPLVSYGAEEARLLDDDDSRRLLWYSAFVTPLHETYQHHLSQVSTKLDDVTKSSSKRGQGKRSNRSLIYKLLVDDLKRPIRDAEAVERIVKASDDMMHLLDSGCDFSATMILLSEIKVVYKPDEQTFHCYMHGRRIDSCQEQDPVWQHAMEFRLLCSKVMQRIGPLWRAALILSIARELQDASNKSGESTIQYAIEGDVIDESQEEWRQGIIERYDVLATALQRIGLVGIWNEKPIADGDLIRTHCLMGIPPGPAFRDVMDEQVNWMTTYPGANVEALMVHLKKIFPDYVENRTMDQKRRP